ncbi:hypothetical protein BY458DRAFT_554046 [Sporodiniella umbellata]|nr:hypothetical protein BY458DRAFT_554046 [Sporodiniella umbellata]
MARLFQICVALLVVFSIASAAPCVDIETAMNPPSTDMSKPAVENLENFPQITEDKMACSGLSCNGRENIDMPMKEMAENDIANNDMPMKEMENKDIANNDMPKEEMENNDMPQKEMAEEEMENNDMPQKEMAEDNMDAEKMVEDSSNSNIQINGEFTCKGAACANIKGNSNVNVKVDTDKEEGCAEGEAEDIKVAGDESQKDNDKEVKENPEEAKETPKETKETPEEAKDETKEVPEKTKDEPKADKKNESTVNKTQKGLVNIDSDDNATVIEKILGDKAEDCEESTQENKSSKTTTVNQVQDGLVNVSGDTLGGLTKPLGNIL